MFARNFYYNVYFVHCFSHSIDRSPTDQLCLASNMAASVARVRVVRAASRLCSNRSNVVIAILCDCDLINTVIKWRDTLEERITTSLDRKSGIAVATTRVRDARNTIATDLPVDQKLTTKIAKSPRNRRKNLNAENRRQFGLVRNHRSIERGLSETLNKKSNINNKSKFIRLRLISYRV